MRNRPASLAREIIAALPRGQWYGSFGMASCPLLGHGRGRGDQNPSLSIHDGDDGNIGVHCFANCDWRDVKEELRRRGLLPERDGKPEKPARKFESPLKAKREEGKLWRSKAAQELWARALPFTPDCAAGKYLIWRGFPPPWPPTFRFHPAAAHPKGGNVTALVAMACRWPNNGPTAVQFTALAPDGTKAAMRPPRWTRGALRGAAVRIGPWSPDKRVVLTEGVEDALAVQKSLPDVAAWATLGANNAHNVVLPTGASVVLALDGDDNGRQAAQRAAQEFESQGHDVKIAWLPDGADPASLFSGRAA